MKTKGQIAQGTETLQNAKFSVGSGPYLVVAHMV